MRISSKIFIFTYSVMMLILIAAGYALVGYLYQEDLETAYEIVQNDNENIYAYVFTIYNTQDQSYSEPSLMGYIQRFNRKRGGSKVKVLESFEEWKEETGLTEYTELPQGNSVTTTVIRDGDKYIITSCRYESRYIINYYDISEITEKRDKNMIFLGKMIIIASAFTAVILYVFARIITKPVTILTDMAESVSAGMYDSRVDADYRHMKSYELTRLGATMNQLADNTEKHIFQLEDEARRKEEFVGNFTHELKTPLTSIIGYADMLRTYDLEPDRRREYSSFIYNEGKRLEQLSLNLLQLIVMNNAEFNLVKTDTDRMFEEIKSMVKFSGKKYCVQVSFSNENAQVMAEPSLLSAAVVNLVDNACKASEKDDLVRVVGKKAGDRYCISIEDEGCGITEADIGKVMEPFYMVDKSRARKQGGAGLGLALSKRIAELHGGGLEIESTPGKGTIVKLFVVIARSDKGE